MPACERQNNISAHALLFVPIVSSCCGVVAAFDRRIGPRHASHQDNCFAKFASNLLLDIDRLTCVEKSSGTALEKGHCEPHGLAPLYPAFKADPGMVS
eukprot:11296117-Karenia_brevis.AAC.1